MDELSVLVVDQDPAGLRALSGRIDDFGHRTFSRRGSPAAIACLRADHMHVVFVSLELPGETARSASCQAVSSEPPMNRR